MPSNLVIHTNPYRPNLNVTESEVEPGLTIFQHLENIKLISFTEDGFYRMGCFVVLHNGVPVLSKDWNVVVEDDHVLQVAYLPKGGGGGSNLKAILGAIIIAVAAFFTFGLSLVAAAAVGVGAFAALSLMTGAVPPPTSTSNSSSSNSPTYSLNAQSNSARLLEAIPKCYGRTLIVPDLASQPYTEYEGNEQYLYQLFCLSLGTVEVEKILIDETNINQFTDAQYSVIYPNQAVTLFPDNVVTSDSVSNLEMKAPNSPGFNILGPYVASPSGTVASAIGIDLNFPTGLGEVDDDGNTRPYSVTVNFEYQQVNDAGTPIGAWTALVTKQFTFASKQPQVVSFRVDTPLIRCQIRGQRITNETGDNRTFEMVQWAGLRSYLQSTYTYGNVTLLAVKMRATAALNATTARKFSVIVKDRVQTWDPINGWGGYVYSDGNPAWIAADMLRDTDYGRGLGTDRLAMTKLYALSQTAASRGDRFNGVFDSTSQLWDALAKVLRCVRTVPIYYAGVIDFIRDQPQTIPTAMFQPANMVAGSFKTTYNFFDVDTPDHVIVQYIDPDTWKTETVTCRLPGETALNPYNVTLFGCTDRNQAFREGISMAAANRDRRRSISFATLSEGFVPRYNGLIRISHDMPLWGYSGRVISFNRATGQLRTTEQIEFLEPIPHVIAFRKKNGSEDGPYSIVRDFSLNIDEGEYGCIVQASTAQKNAIYISNGVRDEFTFYQAGPTEKQGLKALVMSATPDSQGQVNITCINYADSVYSAENGGIVPPPPPGSNLPGVPTAPIVNTVNVVYTTTVGVQNIIASAANGAIYYEFACRIQVNGTYGDWANLGTNSLPTLVINLSPGNWQVRVRGVGRMPGPWATWTGAIEATSLPTARLDTFFATTKLFAIGLSWTFDPETLSIVKSVEVYAGRTNVLGNASRLFTLPYPANSFDHTNMEPGERWYYWARCTDSAGRVGPWFNNSLPITQISEIDADKLLVALTGKIEKTQLAQDLLEEIESDDGALVKVEELESELAAMYTIKTQLTVNGVPYMAGIGVGVENNEGIITSQVLFRADRMALINVNNAGVVFSPFVVDGVNTYLANAFIKNGSIDNLKVGDLYSNNYVSGVSGWFISKGGYMENNGSGGGYRVTQSNQYWRLWVDGLGLPLVEMGVLA